MKIDRAMRAWLSAPAAVLCLSLAVPVSGQTVGQADQAGSWKLYVDLSGARQICFAATQPAETAPKGANRAPVYFYISSWPKDGVKTEISVKLGYVINKAAPSVLTIDAEAFPLFAEGDRAYIGDPTRELKAIEAMKKGSRMTVQAVSAKGTATTDTYSLAGISQALQKLAASCP